MKNTNRVRMLLLMFMLWMISSSRAGLIFSVDFGSDSVNDTTAGNVSLGTPTDITFTNTGLPLANSNGRAAVFNGTTSGIDYGLGAGNELDIDGGGYSTPVALTYHIRVKFDTVAAANQFLMGRHDDTDAVTAIEVLGDDAHGYVQMNGTTYGNTAADCLLAGKWYDIFFRFQGQYAATGNGYFQTSVYDAETSTLVLHSARWGTGARGPEDGSSSFWIGMRGDHTTKNPLHGMVDQVNVWIGTPLSEAEMLALSNPPAVEPVMRGSVLSVDFGSDSVDDKTPGNVSTGIATDVTFTNTSLSLANSNGKAAVFNGTTSGIDYGLGAGNELAIEGGGYSDPVKMTYHIRVKFATVAAANQFLMGRHDDTDSVTAIEVLGDDAHGYVNFNGTTYGNTAENALSSGIWYDIFFRYEGWYQSDTNNYGFFQTSVYNAETGYPVLHSEPWATTSRGPTAGLSSFWVGMRGDHSTKNPLDGQVEQVNVWDRAITEEEMLAMSNPAPLSPQPVIDCFSRVSSNTWEMVIDLPAEASSTFFPKTTTDLILGGWANVAHSTNGATGTFIETNLSYSVNTGSNLVIYLESPDDTAFFRIDEQ